MSNTSASDAPMNITDTAARALILPPFIVAPELPQPALVQELDDDAIKAQVWPIAYEQWIAGGWRSHGKSISPQTRRAYSRAVEDFKRFIGRLPMWRVKGNHVIAWQNDMRSRHLAETTINLSLAGLSSLYEFVAVKFPFPDPRDPAREMFLVERNPTRSVNRSKVDPYKADTTSSLSEDEILAMLRRIDRSTVIGLRDYALVCVLFLTGQRNAAIAELRWGDIKHPTGEGDVITYRWQSKAKSGTDELLRPAYDALLAYLQAAGRLETLGVDDYIFVALSDVAERLPNVKPGQRGPLTGAMVNRIVKKCARRVGLDESRVHTHTLRHSAALFMKRHGVDLVEIQHTLHHSNPNTTMIYLRALEHERHPMWKSIGAFFEMV